jgi:hypothetical protein
MKSGSRLRVSKRPGTGARTVLRALFALGLVLGSASLARAGEEPRPARLFLDYERGAGAGTCLEPSELARAVEQRLGRAVFVAAAEADILTRIRAQRSAHGFRIDVQLLDHERRSLGRRRLHTRARHCSALDDALALVVSLAADVSSAPAAAVPGVASSPVPLAPLETPIEVPESTSEPRLGWQVRPGLGVSALSGLLPSLAWGLSAELELRPPRFWPLWLRAAAWRSQRVAAGADRAEFSAQSVELGVCPWILHWERLESRACAQQWLGRVRAKGVGFDRDQSPGVAATLALGLNEMLSYRLGDWLISASGSLLAPLTQRRYFYVDGSEITLHDQPWVWAIGTISLGLEL